jgi:polygalacturonase
MVLSFLLASSCILENKSKLVTYPAPADEPASQDFSLLVENQEVFVYQARVSAWPINQVWPGYQRPTDQTEMASFAYFDCSGKVGVELTTTKAIETVTVRPLSLGIEPVIEGDKISFEMPGPGQIVVEVNDYHHAFHLFANPIETGKPDPDDPGVHYFGPGRHDAGTIELKSGESVYIEGGAIVHGNIQADDAENIRVHGRGILDASEIGRFAARQMVSAWRCEDLVVEGIIFRDPHVWTVVPVNCTDVRISNVKLVGLWRYNADGIDLVNSQDVLIEDCFVRAFDDNIVLKGLKSRRYDTQARSLKNIVVRNCVLWNDWGRALEIGAETVADTISEVTFEDCDIIHFVHIAMDVQNGDRAVVRDILFRDIRIEDPIKDSARIAEHTYDPDRLGYLIDLNIRANPYSKDTIRGKIEHIMYQQIDYRGGLFPPSTMTGYSDEHDIDKIRLEDVVINGKKVRSPEDLKLTTNEFVKEVTIR